MTEEREYYASNLEEAIDKAASDLGMPSDELAYRVLDEGNSGFLGIGARDARIVVEDPEAPEPLSEQEPPDLPAPPPDAPSYETPGPAPAAEQPDASEDEAEERPPAPDDLLDEVRDLVSTVLEAMGFQAGLDVYDAGGFIAVDVTPDNTALFIGQKGETIDALQYLVNVSVYRERTFVKRVVLDAEGYRQRRVEAIQGMAHRTARRAVREDRTVELPPMNSSERRIVHLFLRDNPGVRTESEGSGDNRRVRVLPT
ncbi:MAG: RNA-binding cell elongation regulator Jag/EloR [Rubrobacter sp.]